jgi:hypothetical protein
MGQLNNQPKLKDKEEWVEREEDEELKKIYEEANEKWMESVTKNMKEGDSIVSVSPFHEEVEDDPNESGIKGAGVYVMKDGKLVKGEGRKREEVMFSNWY